MNKGTAIVGFFVSFLAGMALMYGYDRSKGTAISAETAASTASEHTDAVIPVSAQDPQWGNSNAPVTIVEISDFQCPFCSRVGPTLEQIKKTYGPDKVRIAWKHNPLPFHKEARPAHEASATVFALGGNDAFWKFHDLAFKNARSLTEENFEKWAAESGVDVAKFKAAFKAKKHAAKVDEDQALARKIGASGTPAFRINGVTLSGAQPFDNFKKVIDEQLAAAQKLVAAGTKPEQVYVELTKKNYQEPEKKEPAEREQPAEDKTIWQVPVGPEDPIKGPKDALVTIVEWSEYQCPFCKRVLGTLNQVMEAYPNDVRIVWKENPLPFHPRAEPASVLARTARQQQGDAGFWKAHDALFESQPKLEDADLEKVASDLGLSWATVKANIDNKKFASILRQGSDEAMELNARGTPHFFVNGYRVTGAQPFDKFKEVIDAELAKAKALVAKGTPKAKVYETIMKDAKAPPPPETKDVPPPPADSPFKGSKNAKVVIQEWSDFECPFCKRVGPTLAELEKEYGDKIKLVWRHMPLPFHKKAMLASEASQEVYVQKGNAAFFAYHDKLFESQSGNGLERPNLEKLAAEMGVDMEKFKKALDSGTHKAKIEADMEVAKKAGINGTPAFVINNYFLNGAQPAAAFKKLVNRALKE